MDLDEVNDILMTSSNVVASTEANGQAAHSLEASGQKIVADSSTWDNGLAPIDRSIRRGSLVKAVKKRALFEPNGREDLPRPPKYENLPYATLQTGLVYDVRMRFHVEISPAEADVHPEDPRRIHAIFNAFVQAGLAWETGSPPPSIEFYMARIDARMATREEICLVHTQEHYEWVEHLKSTNC